jgi:predicted outer membrane repeat protein
MLIDQAMLLLPLPLPLPHAPALYIALHNSTLLHSTTAALLARHTSSSHNLFLNNTALYGPAIRALDTLHSYHDTFINNTAIVQGGAIYFHGTLLLVQHSAFINNTAPYGAAIAMPAGNAHILATQFNNYKATDLYFPQANTFNISIDNCTFRGTGGAIDATQRHITIRNSLFQDIHSALSPILLNRSKLGIFNSSFHNNSAIMGGAISLQNSILYGDTCSFTHCSAYGTSGVIDAVSSSLILSKCTFTDNLALLYGGAIGISKSSARIDSCIFSSNYAPVNGAAISVYDSNLFLTGSLFFSNVNAIFGCAVYSEDSNISIYTSRFHASISTFDGGAISVHSAGRYKRKWNSSMIIFDSEFRDCQSSNGGAIQISANALCAMSLINCSFVNNDAYFGGGAVYVASLENLVILNCNFLSNSAGIYGGVLSLSNVTLNIISCSFISNFGLYGGGIMASNNARIDISNTIFENNSASNQGGALYYQLEVYSYSKFVNCFFKLNSAIAGGAISTSLTNKATSIFNNTFWESNVASYGGAIMISGSFYLDGNNLFLKNHASNSKGCSSFDGIGGGIFFGEIDCNRSRLSSALNLTFIRNSAFLSGSGAHISGYKPSACIIDLLQNHSTFSGNKATYGVNYASDLSNIMISPQDSDPKDSSVIIQSSYSSLKAYPSQKLSFQVVLNDYFGNRLQGHHQSVLVNCAIEQSGSSDNLLFALLPDNGKSSFAVEGYVKFDLQLVLVANYSEDNENFRYNFENNLKVNLVISSDPYRNVIRIPIEVQPCPIGMDLILAKRSGSIFMCDDAVNFSLNWITILSFAVVFQSLYIIAAVAFVFYYRKMFNSEQTAFVGIISLGNLLWVASQTLYMFQMSAFNCMMHEWLWQIGFLLIFLTMDLRMYRLHRIFNNASFQVVNIPTSQLIWIGFPVFLVFFIFLFLWTIISPYNVDQNMCISSQEFEFKLLFFILDCFIILMCALFAIRTREIPAQYNESRQTGFVVLGVLMVLSILMLPSMKSSPTVTYKSLRFFLEFWSVFSTYSLLLIPQVYRVCVSRSSVHECASFDETRKAWVRMQQLQDDLSGVERVMFETEWKYEILCGASR